MELSDNDIDRIARRTIEMAEEEKKSFWVEPETHYNDHSVWRGFNPDDVHSLKDLAKAYRSARGLFWKSFLGFAVVGAMLMAAVGLGFKS